MQNWQYALLALTAVLCGAAPLAAQVTQPTQEARTIIDAKCWPDWSEAAVIVRRETLTPVERVSKLARDKHPGSEVIKVTLCEEQGKYVYRLLLRERQGQLKSELLDARQPAGQ
jgi:uncharacterized membrane protein YkoI